MRENGQNYWYHFINVDLEKNVSDFFNIVMAQLSRIMDIGWVICKM